MSEQADQEVPERSTPGRHAWAVACLALGVTSFLLVFPLGLSFFRWVDLWMYQLESPIFTYSQKRFWDILRWLYVLGPELVVALAALIVGSIALARWKATPGWHQDAELVTGGLTCGILVLLTFGLLLAFGILVMAGTAL